MRFLSKLLFGPVVAVLDVFVWLCGGILQPMMPKKISGISMVRKSAISGMFSLLMVKVSPAENSEAK